MFTVECRCSIDMERDAELDSTLKRSYNPVESITELQGQL